MAIARRVEANVEIMYVADDTWIVYDDDGKVLATSDTSIMFASDLVDWLGFEPIESGMRTLQWL